MNEESNTKIKTGPHMRKGIFIMREEFADSLLSALSPLLKEVSLD